MRTIIRKSTHETQVALAAEPALPPFTLAAEVLAKRAGCLGSVTDPLRVAHHHVTLELVGNLAWLAKLAPGEAQAVKDTLIEGERMKASATQKLLELTAEARDLEAAIVERGEARSRKLAVSTKLAQAITQLNDPSCLNLDDGVLLRLQKEVQHLPGEIRDWDSKIAEVDIAIKAIEAAGRFTVAALVPDMIARAKPDYSKSSYPRNEQVSNLNNAGLLA
jgi:hypothetical protein